MNIDNQSVHALAINKLQTQKYRFDKDFASILALHFIAKQYVLLFCDNKTSDER